MCFSLGHSTTTIQHRKKPNKFSKFFFYATIANVFFCLFYVYIYQYDFIIIRTYLTIQQKTLKQAIIPACLSVVFQIQTFLFGKFNFSYKEWDQTSANFSKVADRFRIFASAHRHPNSLSVLFLLHKLVPKTSAAEHAKARYILSLFNVQ